MLRSLSGNFLRTVWSRFLFFPFSQFRKIEKPTHNFTFFGYRRKLNETSIALFLKKSNKQQNKCCRVKKKLSQYGKPFGNNNCVHFRESKFTGDWAEYVHWFKIVDKTEPLNKVIYMYMCLYFPIFERLIIANSSKKA